MNRVQISKVLKRVCGQHEFKASDLQRHAIAIFDSVHKFLCELDDSTDGWVPHASESTIDVIVSSLRDTDVYDAVDIADAVNAIADFVRDTLAEHAGNRF
ncbi:MAG: hypothetical protein E6Q97_07640 [Desulfurellales bacterium]|nr:MAG: hypothetical protein E6Q97_07640 [Desulfurellales bacterium]